MAGKSRRFLVGMLTVLILINHKWLPKEWKEFNIMFLIRIKKVIRKFTSNNAYKKYFQGYNNKNDYRWTWSGLSGLGVTTLTKPKLLVFNFLKTKPSKWPNQTNLFELVNLSNLNINLKSNNKNRWIWTQIER